MQHIKIIRVTSKQQQELQNICRTTFLETFSESNSQENMRQYLDSSFSMDQLEMELNHPSSEFYLAYVEGIAAGYLKINWGEAQKEDMGATALEIQRIYVLRHYHGKKVGQLLYQKALDVAEEKKFNHVWLGVWEKNLRAIRFYQKNGFAEFDQHVFVLGTDQQRDILMKKRVND